MYKNNQPPLPISLQQKRARNVLVRVIPCILLLFLFASAIILWGDMIFPFDKSYDGGSFIFAKIITYAFILALPFLITGVPFKLIDRSFSGVITNIEIKETMGVYSTGIGKNRYYPKNDLILTIECDNGKTIKYTAMSLGMRRFTSASDSVINGRIELHDERYRVGDKVYKYYGFKHLFTLQNDKRDAKHCIVCGTVNRSHDKKCWGCKCDLVYKYSIR